MEGSAEWEPLKWEQLTVVGKPLLSGAALGATPLMWIACRAQPRLVHIFCDTQLQDIWRFPADPVFVLIGAGSSLKGKGRNAQCDGCLLVITRDGCIWIVQLSKTRASPSRPSKMQRTKNVEDIHRIKPSLPKSTIVEATVKSSISRYKDSGGDTTFGNHEPKPTLSSFQTCWKELAVETFTPALTAVEVKNVVVGDTLLGTVPGAKVAAFGPNSYVAVVTPFGSLELLYFERLAASRILSNSERSEFPSSAPLFGREPTCLLVVSSARHSQNHGPGEGQAVISQNLFETLSSPSADASDHEILFIIGAMDGKVCTSHVQKGTVVDPAPYVVCDLQQPIVAIIPVAYPFTIRGDTTQIKARGANWVVVIGLLGQVAFLSSARDQAEPEELSNSPFLPRHPQTSIGVDNKYGLLSTLKELVSNEGVERGPITSACLFGAARLCYTAGSKVFIAELFENLGSVGEGGELGTGVKDLRSSSPGMLLKLPSQRVSISNIAAISGPGLFTYKGTRPLVALTGAGSLLSIKIPKQFASPVTADNPAFDRCQGSPKPCSGNSVKVLLQSVADAESCRDAIQSREQALTLAMNELALALLRAGDIATNKRNLAFTSCFKNNRSTSKEGFATANVQLPCTLTATPVPSTSLGGDQLSFGGVGFGTMREQSNFEERSKYNCYKMRLDISLVNHSTTPLTQYWSLVLELQSCLSTATPTVQYSFTINNNLGLPVGSQWNRTIHLRLPGGPWAPVMANVYLCHIHDSHKALLQSFRGSGLGRSGQNFGRASSAACVVLLRQRVDLFLLLQNSQSTVGPTSWTPALGGKSNLRTSTSSLTGMGEVEMLDLRNADMSVVGDQTWSFSFDAEHTVTAACQNALSRAFQQASTSTGRRLRLTLQEGDAIAITIDGRRGPGGEFHSIINAQTPGLLLGILLREALVWQLMTLEDEALGGNRKNVVLHRNESPNFMERLNQVQALLQRGRAVLNLWGKLQRFHAPATEDLVLPLLGHTYELTAELICTYKSCREEFSFTLR